MKSHCLGFGLGLRSNHFQDILDLNPAVDWFEIISENFMVPGGKPKYYLHKIREKYNMTMHGVSLSIGSTDRLNYDYLKSLKALIQELKPAWVSDHLCWTSIGNLNSHDLLPLPYTEEALEHVVCRVKQVQDYLGQQILLENVSSYLTYHESQLSEWEFLAEICERSDCFILLDINNLYVSARNHDFNPVKYLQAMNPRRVRQLHLAGHTDCKDYLIDTHDTAIADSVWSLYKDAIHHFGAISTLIERDDNIPPLIDLLNELAQARHIAEDLLATKKASVVHNKENTPVRSAIL